MRLPSLLAICAASALLMPLAANAGNLSPEQEKAYMAQCQNAATAQGLDAATAKTHCECGAATIKKEFSDKELKELDSKQGVDAKLMQRAKTAVQQACVKGA